MEGVERGEGRVGADLDAAVAGGEEDCGGRGGMWEGCLVGLKRLWEGVWWVGAGVRESYRDEGVVLRRR